MRDPKKGLRRAPSRPSIPAAVPSVEKVSIVVMVDADLAPPSDPSVATINKSESPCCNG
jgi:hypothetical protein